MINTLMLLSGNDIPFPEMQTVIHPPTIREIAFMGEDMFYQGCGLLTITKYDLEVSDKSILENKTNFDIFMSVMTDTRIFSEARKDNVMLALNLFFPKYNITINKKGFLLIDMESGAVKVMDSNAFEKMKSIILEIICLNTSNNAMNPSGDVAERIAAKIAEGRRRRAKLKGESSETGVLPLYVSILSVGESKDMNSLLDYTIYQLFDEFERYQLKMTSDIYIQGKMAGAKGMKEADNWMKNIHSRPLDDN